MSDTAETAPSAPTTIPELLLALQAVDTQADQLGHRREHSLLRDDLASATAAMRTWEQQRTALRSRIDELGVSIEAAEHRGAELLAHRVRLEQQMKTVIAPREAEALMHEMATLTEQIDELDGQELESLEEQSALDDQLSEHLGGEEQLRTRLGLADDALAAEVGDIDSELAELVRTTCRTTRPAVRCLVVHVRSKTGRTRCCSCAAGGQAVPGVPPRTLGRRDRHREGRSGRQRRHRLPRLRPSPHRLIGGRRRVLLVHRHVDRDGRGRLP